MCGRFININKINKLHKIFEIDKISNIDYSISYNIAPSQSSIIITNLKFINIERANWGIKFYDKKQNQEKNIINSRLETINKKILFKESFEKRKCVIPANGFYEWSIKDNIKTPYFIHMPEKETIYFAGIWKYLNFQKNTFKVFSIITKPANKFLRKIHERMPVILSTDESKFFLDNNNPDFILNNVQSIIEDYLEFYKVSKYVNNPLNNSLECIKPII